MPTRIYPGQTVDSKIKVTDGRGREVKGVDITAFAYNSLLDYYVPDLPYYGNTPKGREKRDSYYAKEKSVNYSQPLTQKNYRFWNKIAHLDDNMYYRFIFPTSQLFEYTIRTPDGTTEFAPYVMSGGYAVHIYAIEVDEKPVYFSWAEQPIGYSFPVDGKYHKIRLRLHDRVIIIDKHRFERGKKTILSLDLNHMPQSTHVRTVYMNAKNKGTKKRPNMVYEFADSEKKFYSKYISVIPVIQDRFTYMTQSSFGSNVVIPVSHPQFQKKGYWNRRKTHHTVGPLKSGMYRYMDGVEYAHEGGYLYKYDQHVVYKYPKESFPASLNYSISNDFHDLNDFHFTPKEFGRKIGLVAVEEDKWFPGIIQLHNTKIHIPRDKEETGVRGLIMRNNDTGKWFVPIYNRTVLGNNSNKDLFGIRGMSYGCYDIFALYANGNYLRYDQVPLLENTYTEVKMNECPEHSKDSLSAKWLQYQPTVEAIRAENNKNAAPKRYAYIGKQHFNSANDVRGVVVDEDGEPLIGVSIILKGTQAGTITDIEGEFILDLHGAENTLVFSYIGYVSEEVEVTRGSSVVVVLKEDQLNLDEVVVVAYGSVRKRSMTGSVMSMAAGAAVTKEADYVAQEEIEDDGSTRLYEELMVLNGMRSNFSDVGFWEPKLVTDKRGEADFTVTFPDNITQWQSVVYAMNRKLKTGVLRRNINSYKPLIAELKTPQFLVEGDSTLLSTYIRNYTKDKEIDGDIIFVNNGDSVFRTPIHFEASYLKYLPVTTPSGQDSLTFSYRFTRDDGYSDGEQRSIPVEKQGVEIADGTLQILRNGDCINITAASDEEVNVSVTGEQIDIYMNAANYLMGYAYACNEQLASKLIGLLNYRLYKQFKGEKFKHDKNVNEIINRLLRNQNSKKLWSWWANDDNTSYWMSAHILRALNMARQAGYKVDLDIKKVKYDYMDIHRFRYTSLSDIDVLNALIDWEAEQNYGEIIELFENEIANLEDSVRSYLT